MQVVLGALVGAMMVFATEPSNPLRFLVIAGVLAAAMGGFAYWRHDPQPAEDRRTRVLRAVVMPLSLGIAGCAIIALRAGLAR